MLTFEEFFKKKKIDLAALNQGEPALFMEFASHYDQMGEKSFDHVKKYLFNKLRKQYHLAPEIKAEPIRNENQLAEQTVFDSLSAAIAEPVQIQGFKPGFKAAPPNPAEQTPPAEAAPAKPGFTPRFKAGATKPAEPNLPAEEADKPAEQSIPENNTGTPAIEAPKKPGFTPRFKTGVTKPAEPTTEETHKPAEQSDAQNKTADDAPKKPGFTPRFKAGVTKPAAEPPPVETNTDKPAETVPKPAPVPQHRNNVVIGSPEDADVPEFDFTGKQKPPAEAKPVDAKIDKLAEQADRLASDFKSKFKATHLPKHAARPKPEETEDNPAMPLAPAADKNKEVDAEKIAYKPRFNAKKLPPKPPEE